MSSFESFFAFALQRFHETKRIVDSDGHITRSLWVSPDILDQIQTIEIKSGLLRPFVYFVFQNGLRIREMSCFCSLWLFLYDYRALRSQLHQAAVNTVTKYNEELFHFNDLSLDEEMKDMYDRLVALGLKLPELRRRISVQPRAKLSDKNVKRLQLFYRCLHNRPMSLHEVQVRYQSKPNHVRRSDLKVIFTLSFRERMLKELMEKTSALRC